MSELQAVHGLSLLLGVSLLVQTFEFFRIQNEMTGDITLHTISSYFVSGWVKFKRREWRDGSALVMFLDGGIYGPLSANSFFRLKPVGMLCSWSFMAWEGLAPFLLLSSDLAMVYCLIAACCHFLVFWFFGLNRFFWAWCASFPALIYCSGRLPI